MAGRAPNELSLLLVGRIRKAHGIRGEVLVEVLTDAPGAIFAPGARVYVGSNVGDVPPQAPTLTVESVAPFKDVLRVAFEELADRTEAERWRDRFLAVPADEVAPPAPGQVFVHDLVGLTLVDAGGEAIGTVLGTFEVAGRLLLEVQRKASTVLVPYEVTLLVGVDLEAQTLTMHLPAGLFE